MLVIFYRLAQCILGKKYGPCNRKLNLHHADFILFGQIVKSSIFHRIGFIILGNLSAVPVIIEKSN